MRPTPRLLSWILVAVPLALFSWDASRAPANQWSTRVAVHAIHLYQRTLSPRMPSVGVRCRFRPTCSRYSAAVLERHGIVRGTALTLVRLVRCGPWTPAGTVDPPP